MRALIHFHAGGDYQPQAFLPRPVNSLFSSLLSFTHPLSRSLSCDSCSFCPSFVRLLHFCLSLSLSLSLFLLSFRCTSQPLLDCSLLGGYSDNVVWMQYKGLRRRRLWQRRSCDCGCAQIASLRLHVRTCQMRAWSHVEWRPPELGAGSCGAKEVARRRLTSISIEIAPLLTRAPVIGNTRDEMGERAVGGERIESRGEAICLPNEMSPRPRWDVASKEANDHPWNGWNRSTIEIFCSSLLEIYGNLYGYIIVLPDHLEMSLESSVRADIFLWSNVRRSISQ